jgi:toxin HigB-1
MLRSIKHRSLKRFWERHDAAGIRPDWIKRVGLILSALDAASRPEDMNVSGLSFHPLKGNRAGEYAVSVSRNWRITFRWQGQDAIDVNLEDYHGSG